MLKNLGNLIQDVCYQAVLILSKKNGRSIYPKYLTYAVTWRCNFRCIICDTWKITPETRGREITPSELDSILLRDAVFLKSMKKIGITGGEPFLRTDIVEIIRVLRKRLPQTQVSIVSNGFLTSKILEDLREIRSFYPMMQFSVSLDGIGEVHDSVRGVKGAYERSLASIEGALSLGFTVTSGMTVSKINAHQVESLAALLDRMGVDFSFNLLEKGQNFNNNTLDAGLTDSQIQELIRILKNYSHHYYMDNMRRILQGGHRSLPCYSGFVSYFLKPDGELAICNLKGDPIGNLCSEPFSRIAKSPKAAEIRLKYRNCLCWSQCEVKYSAASSPINQLVWLITHPEKKKVLARYAPRTFKKKS